MRGLECKDFGNDKDGAGEEGGVDAQFRSEDRQDEAEAFAE